jgi:hypothetical protein
MPPQALGIAVIGTALALAAWCLVTTVRNRTLTTAHWAGLGLVQTLVVAEVVTAVVALARGHHPADYVTFVGYLAAIFLILPLAGLLARLEPTRWGTLIAGVGAVVIPVLVVRINQLWGGVG